ncbi:MAG: response regulator [Thermoproteota archaeon]|nr:response regulator [Thermoproteota archaeon]
MNILIIEDDEDICQLYSVWLEENRHQFVIAKSAEDGLLEYKNSLQKQKMASSSNCRISNFDLVVLDYDIPLKKGSFTSGQNGLFVAQEILGINPDQRLMFASAWPQKIFTEYVRTLNRVIEILQKPFEKDEFIELAENVVVYDYMKKISKQMRNNGRNPNKPDINNMGELFKLLVNLQKAVSKKDGREETDVDIFKNID